MKPSYKDQIKAIEDACKSALMATHTVDRVKAINSLCDLASKLPYTDYVEDFPKDLMTNIMVGESNYRILRMPGQRAMIQKYVGPQKVELWNLSFHQVPEWWTGDIMESERADVFMRAYMKGIT